MNMTGFKRMGSILSLVFSNYNEARAFREAFIRLMVYTILFAIGYKLNLVFDNVPDGRIFDGYAMAALFCGLSVLSGFLNNMICISGCLTMLIFMGIKLAISMIVGIIALPICVFIDLYRLEWNCHHKIQCKICLWCFITYQILLFERVLETDKQYSLYLCTVKSHQLWTRTLSEEPKRYRTKIPANFWLNRQRIYNESRHHDN